MKTIIRFLLLFTFLFSFTWLRADPSGYGSGDVSVGVDYNYGSMTVTWKNYASNSTCPDEMDTERVWYRLGTSGTWIQIYGPDDGNASTPYHTITHSTHSNGGSANFTTLPGSFFMQTVQVRFAGRWCERQSFFCGGGCKDQDFEYTLNNSIDAPRSVSATMDSYCDRVDLSWQDGTNVNGFSSSRVQIRRVVGTSTASHINSPYNSASFYEGPAGNNLTFDVQTYMHWTNNGIVRQAWGGTVRVTGRKYGPPGQATGLYLDQATCDGQIEVNWNWSQATNPSNFVVQRATNSTFTANVVELIVSGSDRNIRDAGTAIGSTYYYRVFAQDDCPGNASLKARSQPSSTETQVGLGVPPAPIVASISIDTAGKAVTVNWADNTNLEDGFKVLRQSGSGQVEFDVAANSTSYQDRTADNCTNYTYLVKTYNSCKTTGVISGNSISGYIPSDVATTFSNGEKIEATDGEFGERIDLKWNTQNRQNDNWNILRINPKTNDTVPLINLDGRLKSYSDNTANANTIYKYLIQGESDCAGNVTNSNTSEDIGFRLAYGTINGQITYDGGTAVEGVKVVADATSGTSGKSGHFNGTSAFAEIANHQDLQNNEISILAYIRPNSISGNKVIASKRTSNTGFELFINGTNLKLTVGTATYTATSNQIVSGNWISIGATIATDSVYLYINGQTILQTTNNQSAAETTQPLLIGKSSTGNYFDGQIDEVRYYNVALSTAQIQTSYDVYINPSMANLKGYWRFDEDFGSTAYDYSKTLQNANKNHARLQGVTFSSHKPTTSQLTAGAYTNKNGSYFIPFVPYLGNGDNFIITPSYGTHTFSPANKSIFVGGVSPNFSGIDFTDNSSFTVNGSVKFKNTSCFVENIFVLVDGEVVVQGGSPVQTNDSGKFKIQVPIGQHVISVRKDGHVFSEGRFPKTGLWDFQQNENLNPFIDSTLVRVVGRVAGGGIQAALPAGLGRGTNNIGQAKVRFKSQQGNGCLDTTISTNSSTGEYAIDLPPMKFEIPDFRIDSNQSVRFENNTLMDLTPIHPEKTSIDTVWTSSTTYSGIDSAHYNYQQSFIYQAPPSINVLSENFDQKFGSDSITFSSQNANFKIPTDTLNLPFPVFEENQRYTMQIEAFEIYKNYDGAGSSFIEDKVPFGNGKIEINNELASAPIKEFNYDRFSEFNGTQEYSFTAGQAETATNPFPAYNYTKQLFITLKPNGGNAVEWTPNTVGPQPYFRGIIFGGKALGNSFATSGPDVVTMILRDPPGSNSTATWEKNTSHTTVSSFENTGSVGVDLGYTTKLGTKFTVGLGYQTETEISNTLDLNTTISTDISTNGELVEVVENTFSVSTSADEEFVGAHADIFVGKALNMDFGLSQVIGLVDTALCADDNTDCIGNVLSYNGKGFKIASQKTLFAVPGTYSTQFIYTQNTIENSVIPDLIQLRNNLLQTDSRYNSNLPTSHQYYGFSNDNPVFNDPSVGTVATPNPDARTTQDSSGVSYSFSGYTTVNRTVNYGPFNLLTKTVKVTLGVDSVWVLNQQIKIWEDALARNEKEKIQVSNLNKTGNISIGGGAAATYSNTTSRDVSEGFAVNFNLAEQLILTIGAEIGGNGVEVEQSANIGYSHNTGGNTTKSTSTTFSYTIDDTDSDDKITTDVYTSKDGFSPIFRVRGGVSSCPVQGESVTKYYRPGQIIDQATVSTENPKISATPPVVYNIPADGEANITLTLSNDANYGNVYDLRVLENTNPNGAILTIDGINPNRSFAFTNPQSSLNKTLVIKKGPNHIKYDSIGIVLHSQCQYSFSTGNNDDIADTVYISVNFLPSCTDVEISSPLDQFVVNNSYDNQLPILIDGYDVNHGGFEKLQLQYKPSAQASWITLPDEWFLDSNSYVGLTPPHPSPKLIPRDKAYIQYDFEMNQLIDQPYQLRAVSTCKIPGNPNAQEFSPIIGGIADRLNPHPFGSPTPADGVLDPNDDISIQFNENIEAGSLTPDNFQFTGVVNGQELRHDKAVAFNGTNSFMEIANGFDFASGSFTIEFWAKRNTLGTKQTIISQGINANNTFNISFNAANKIEIQVGSHSYESTFSIIDLANWHHYSVIFDKENLSLEITDRTSASSQTSTNNNFFASYQSGGKTYIGKNAVNNSDFYNGSIHQLRIWNKPLSNSTISSHMSKNLHGREAGLIGYWPMDEGKGDLAQDNAKSRNAILNAEWEINPKSSSAAFDGIDDLLVVDTAGGISINSEMDMTIELWFRTTGGQVQSLLSNGSGLFATNDVNQNGWNIEMSADNSIHIQHDSISFEVVSQDFADGAWHHFALVLNRLSNLTAYIDGVEQNSLNASELNGFGGEKLAIGARYLQNGTVVSYDQFFNGNIDEVRIWNSARLRENLEFDMFNRLKGDEFGLLAYYPFELFINQLGVPTLTPSFRNSSYSSVSNTTNLNRTLDLTAANGASISTLSPAIALQRPVKNIAFSWSVNGDKIVITPNEAPANIENVTLNISVKNVKDLHGNTMQSPKSWIAFINKNQVVWQDAEKNLLKQFGDTMTFTAKIVNSGGEVKNYTISNLPAWLTASSTTGTIQPQSVKTIVFTVNSGIIIGKYAEDIILRTDFGFNEKLFVNLKVEKQSPDFSFNRNLYSKSMSIVGQIAINGNVSVNAEDKLVAYINNEIRGVANLRYVPSLDKYIAFLDVYSNTMDSINFKVWNATEGQLHENVSPNVYFVENNLVGSLLNPQLFDAVNNLAMPIVLNQGWNWVSFPLTDTKMRSFPTFLHKLNFNDGDLVKTIGNNTFAQYGGTAFGWTGSLTRDGLNNHQSYLIYISNQDTLDYKGLAIDPDTLPINVASGWNRIGFISTKNIEINSALANYNATDGDLIKSQQAFAVYLSSLGWIGSLTTLEPTEGYLLKAASSTTFVYPRKGLFRLKENALQEKLVDVLPSNFTLNPNNFEASTNAIIKINTCEELLNDSTWSLVAFKGAEVRGYSKSTIKVNEDVGSEYFITIYGEGNETYNFEMINSLTEEKIQVIGQVSFEKNQLQGNINNPLKFEINKPIDCDQFIKNEVIDSELRLSCYPNPFSQFVTIVVPKEISENGVLEIIDQTGRVLIEQNVGSKNKIFLNGAQLQYFVDGVYQVKFTDGETVKSEKLVRIRGKR
ncbi:MAG: T9SS C-terminal target domain-containing protein [Bacteroidetes bacterium]|nr:MAG: T9SS C-terminal target domain-containing protein [Bacteroidota bacterium]MBL1144836.1 T9SS C-terminal target domain-containing protein [Bacteroidota bacterium]NOG57630.1 T9SS type A sorting domain-containing protein [Bacteroidota bacterium]